jgi:hypothetical protein
MTESILLGTVAIRVPGQKLDWNSEGMVFSKHADANRLLKRTYRDGWHTARF